MKPFNVRLSISDEAQNLISRYYLKNVTNLTDVIDSLGFPLRLSSKTILVDMIKTPKQAGIIRGALEYNMHLVHHFLVEDRFDACLVPHGRFPDADVHIIFGIRNQKFWMSLLKLENKGGTPFWSGNFREFKIEDCIESFQYYFNDKT